MSEEQIFQLLGIAYLAAGAGMLINPKLGGKLLKSFVECTAATYLSGFASLVVGYLLIVFYSAGAEGWGVILPVVGWLAFIKGILIVALPKVFAGIAKTVSKKEGLMKFMAAISLVLGVLLTYLGYFVVL